MNTPRWVGVTTLPGAYVRHTGHDAPSMRWIYEMVWSGKLPAVERVGERWKYNPDRTPEIVAAIDREMNPAAPAKAA